MIRELEQAANNRFYEWLGSTDKSTDAEVADLLAGNPTDWPQPDDPVVPSPPRLSSPSHLYKSPPPPVDEEVSKYDIESDWMDSESDEADQSPSPRVVAFSSSPSAFRPIQPQLGRQLLCLACYVSRANHRVMDRPSTPLVVNALRASLNSTESWTSATIRISRSMLSPSPHQ